MTIEKPIKKSLLYNCPKPGRNSDHAAATQGERYVWLLESNVITQQYCPTPKGNYYNLEENIPGFCNGKNPEKMIGAIPKVICSGTAPYKYIHLWL